jgi:dihydroorotate dehydrogenase subfamily 2
MKRFFLNLSHFTYKTILRRFIFLFDSELVHDFFIDFGEFLGSSKISSLIFKKLFRIENNSLRQKIAGIDFKNPVGLAAGFDYNAKLTQILPVVGFGFESIGSITNLPYEGNPKPRLGRLIKSRSLLVNKGFKNEGIVKISEKLKKLNLDFPVGLSIGKTNFQNDRMTQENAVSDIVSAFKIAEKANLRISYYELNISCPNLYGNVTFYTPKNLEQLLLKVTKLKLKKPLFIKMPIEEGDKEVLSMIEVIVSFPNAGIILGNLQKDRSEKNIVKSELEKYSKGNFSGKPTWERSNQLIELVYREYGKKLVIVGCGGIFSAEDAYKKIKLGATLVQFITGMIFEGPQLAAQINLGLIELLKKDGFKNISEAVGIDLV